MRLNLGRIHQFPGLRRFLVARFFYALGINTAVAFAVVYASQTIGWSDQKIYLLLLVGTCVAIPTAVICGNIVDRVGPKPVLSFALLLWIGLFLFAVAIPWLSLIRDLWWAVGCVTGLAMAAVWTADRPFMMGLSPPQYIGEFFGLHGTVGKLGRVVGPVLWATISVNLGLGQPAALLSLAVCLVLSYVILRGVGVPATAPSVGALGQPHAGDGC